MDNSVFQAWLRGLVVGDDVIIVGYSEPQVTKVESCTRQHVIAGGRKFRRQDGRTVNWRNGYRFRREIPLEIPLEIVKPSDAIMESIEAKEHAWEISSQNYIVISKMPIAMLRKFVLQLRKTEGCVSR